MKIVFISLASSYTEGMTYQENLLGEQIIEDGHDLTIITDCFKFVEGLITETEEEDSILCNGTRLIRKKYKNICGKNLSGKIRAINHLYILLEEIQPDIIFHHSLQTYELLTCAKYKKAHTHVKLYVDNHADMNNSARSWFSKYVLHSIFYKIIINKALPFIDRVFYITKGTYEFIMDLYAIPEKKMEFYPLGGVIIDETKRIELRNKVRNQLKIRESDILLVHSGKIDEKKRTEDLLRAFMEIDDDKLKLLIIGRIEENIKDHILKLINSDKRICFVGWKTSQELIEYLCACDLYIQPGGQSATLQNAACLGTSIATFPHESYKYLFKNSVIYVENTNDMIRLFGEIITDDRLISRMRIKSFAVAEKYLNYKVLSKRLY